MKSNHTFLFIFLLPVFMVALLSMSINLISIYKLKQQFEFNIKTQTQDLMVVEEAANLSSDLATLQKRISNTLDNLPTMTKEQTDILINRVNSNSKIIFVGKRLFWTSRWIY